MTAEVICVPCFGYGRRPSGEVDWHDGTDRGLHCDDCDGRGVVLVELEAADDAPAVEAPARAA